MNITPYEIALIGGGFTIVGVLIGSLVTYLFSVKLADNNSRREAGRRLREAFAEELALLHPENLQNDLNVGLVLKEAFPKHSRAVIEFSYYLHNSEKQSFQEAWKSYSLIGGSVSLFDYYMRDNKKTNPREIFAQRINTILEFTKI